MIKTNILSYITGLFEEMMKIDLDIETSEETSEVQKIIRTQITMITEIVMQTTLELKKKDDLIKKLREDNAKMASEWYEEQLKLRESKKKK